MPGREAWRCRSPPGLDRGPRLRPAVLPLPARPKPGRATTSLNPSLTNREEATVRPLTIVVRLNEDEEAAAMADALHLALLPPWYHYSFLVGLCQDVSIGIK